MTDHWTHRLSEYLDDELSATERLQIEEHLGACSACRQTLEELRAGVARAGSLEDGTPERDLWPGVAERIGAARPEVAQAVGSRWRRLRLTLTVPQLATAALALMAGSAGAAGGGWPGWGCGGARCGWRSRGGRSCSRRRCRQPQVRGSPCRLQRWWKEPT